jgi:hypothetical protein
MSNRPVNHFAKGESKKVLAECVLRLKKGEDGADIVDTLRGHYTPHSLATNVCKIKRLAVESLDKDGKRHHAYDDTDLRRHAAQEPGIAMFLQASLWEQYRMQCHHAARPSWSKDAEKALSELKLLPDNFATLAVTATETATILRDKRTARRGRIKQVVRIPNAAQLLESATAILENATVRDSYTRLGCALGLVSGRRCAELFNGKSTFTKVGERMVIFDGQIKKPVGEARPYKIPLVCPADSFLSALAVLREKQGDVSALDEEQIQDRYGGHFTHPLMQRTMPGVPKFHALRSMYARYVEHCYIHDHTYNYLCSEILGHETEHQSLSYISVELDDIDTIKNIFGPLYIDDGE